MGAIITRAHRPGHRDRGRADASYGYAHRPIPDRIEAASWAAAALATGGDVVGARRPPGRHDDFPQRLPIRSAASSDIEDGPDGGIRFWHPGGELHAVALETDVHPGFMTDWQQPMVVALTQARGLSIVHETVYERRLGYTDALSQMGATIQTYRDCLGGTPCRFGRRNFQSLRGRSPARASCTPPTWSSPTSGPGSAT